MASRRKARILAFQALYFYDANRSPEEDLISFTWIDEKKLEKYRQDGTEDFSKLLIIGTLENLKEIDNKIKNHLDNWEIDRLNRVDLAILRLSTYSLLFQKDIHPSITIEEAIEICREYGTDDSYKFVNGVLDNIRKSLDKAL